MIPVCCQFCPDKPATHVAAQSDDHGHTLTWVLVCEGHAEDWNDDQWTAPIFALGPRIE